MHVFKNNKFKKVFENNIYMLKFLWKYSRSNVVLRLLSTLTAPVQPFIFIITMKLAIDGIAEKSNLQYLFIIILTGFAVGSISALFNSWVDNNSSAKAQKLLSKGIQDELLHKAMSLDLSCYDDSEYFDKYTRAMKEAESRATEVLNSVVDVLSGLMALTMILSLLIALSPFVILICLLVLVINIKLNMMMTKVVFEQDLEQTRPNREADYAKKIFYEFQYAQELRMGKLGNLMLKKFNLSMDKSIQIIGKYCNKFVFFHSGFKILGFALMSSVMCFAAWQINKGNLSIGDFAALLNGSQQLLEALFNLFQQVPRLFQNSLYIDNLRSVLDYSNVVSTKENCVNACELEDNSILIKNVSFKYPKKENFTLKNINIEIKHGSKTAIVGYNGAGKSTLVKLILRFYDPYSGSISLSNKEYTDLELKSLRNKFGTVFQNHKCYALSIAENVCLDDNINKITEQNIINALKFSGIYEKISSLEKGIYTNISREFDNNGAPLSGGEEQKIAISRAVVENKEILILDEPSSSLDPVAEYEVNKKIIELSTDKTVLFISHRLSTVRMADIIYMIDGGEVIEKGSHDELIKLDGKYAEMFYMQSENYK